MTGSLPLRTNLPLTSTKAGLPGSSCGEIETIVPSMPLRSARAMRQQRRLHAAGGCDFAGDPAARADATTIFWHHEANARVVSLTASIRGQSGLPFSPAEWPGSVVVRAADDGTHLVVHEQGISHQLWLPQPVMTGSLLAAVLPLDESAPYRAEAALLFWQHAIGGQRRAPHSRSRRLNRLVPTLRALDGRLTGASYRLIAEEMFGTGSSDYETWKTSSARDRVIRLVRAGVALMKGGYLRLLQSRSRD